MGRGGGGGGRSSGGGGSRGSGGRIGGSSHRGGFGSRPDPGPSFRPSFRPYYSRPSFYPRHWRSHRTVVVDNRLRTVGDQIVSVLVALVVCIVLAGMLFRTFAPGLGMSNSITPSTIEREPLPAGSVIETEYFTDNLGWIDSGSKLESGMKHFYKETGVQPYLYITDSIEGSTTATSSNMEVYANKLYDELFDDEAHVLVLFHEYNSSGKYSTWYVAGKQAKTVVDSEGADILLDYIASYYYSDYTEDEMFSKAFSDAADRMMTVTKSPWPKVIIAVVVLAGVVIAFMWWRAAQKRKAEEAAETERILNSDLGSLGGDSSLSDLEDKYK